MADFPQEGIVWCNLRRIMNERHLTVSKVARLANLSRPTVRKLRDNQINSVSMTTVAKLCSALKIGTGVLFSHFSSEKLLRMEIEFKDLQDSDAGRLLMGADES
jgi:DNA-binding Xre family transcriptional regulator